MILERLYHTHWFLKDGQLTINLEGTITVLVGVEDNTVLSQFRLGNMIPVEQQDPVGLSRNKLPIMVQSIERMQGQHLAPPGIVEDCTLRSIVVTHRGYERILCGQGKGIVWVIRTRHFRNSTIV